MAEPTAHESVSIHAPARGATRIGLRGAGRPFGFNPRSRAGSDLDKAGTQIYGVCFNPRSRAGSDGMSWTILLAL